MAIDNAIYDAAAVKGDVAGPVIQTIVALRAVVSALEGQANGEDIQVHLKLIKECITSLDQRFDSLTGWTPDEH